MFENIKNELISLDENLFEESKTIFERNIRFGFHEELSLLGLFIPYLNSNSTTREKTEKIISKYIEKSKEKIKDLEIIKKIEQLEDENLKEAYEKNHKKVIEIIFTKITQIDVALAIMSSKVNDIINKKYLPNKEVFLNFVEHAYSQISQIYGISNYTNLFDDFIINQKYPEEYKEVLKITKENLTRNQEEINEILQELKKNQKYPNEIFKGRIKSPASVFKKVYVRKEKVENIVDFVAIRIITNTIADCYSWLGTIYELYPPRLAKFKDYILHPKPNGYKSLHIVCDTIKGPVEFQIRTHSMHKFAEFGIAAHWKYKTKGNNKMLEKIRNTLLTQDPNFGQGFLFAFTPKKDIILLENGASIIDFAYSIHTQIGDHLSHAEINNEIVPLDTKLKDFDLVKLHTDPKKKPNRSWLEFVVSNKAK